MSKKDDLEIINFANYTDDEIYEFREIALRKHDKIIEEWAIEIKKLYGEENFDQYTRKGEKRINKIMKKYSEPLADADITLSMLQEELDKRENYIEQQKYLKGGSFYDSNIGVEEFIKQEQEKTERIREIIGTDDE